MNLHPFFTTTILLATLDSIVSFSILLLPRNDLDILYNFRGLTEALVQNGHKVTVVANADNPEISALFNDSRASLIYHRYPVRPAPDNFDYLYTDEKYEATYVEQHLKRELTEECMKVVYSDDLYERIKVRRFHLAIVDSSMFCYHIVPYKLQIPFVSLGTSIYPYLMRMHPLLSVEPCLMKDDSFMSRIYRLVSGIYGEIQPKLLIDEAQFAHAVPDRLFYSLREVASNSSLWFVIRDPVLDCPLPVSPIVVQLGSLTQELNRRLPSDSRRFVDSSTRSIIVIWFSHSLRNLTARIQDKFSAAMRKSSQLYVWHRENTTMPDNVRTDVSASLNHLLQLPRVKLLITDCNTFAVSEAIRFAVPLLCMPILGEHRYNTYRVVTKNIGLHLDIRKFRAQDLTKRARSIMKGENYRENIKRLSLTQRHFPDPKYQAVFWIEHILKFGSVNLRTSAREQSLYQFLMLDIYLAAFAGSIMLAYLFKYTLIILKNTQVARRIYNKLPAVAWMFKAKPERVPTGSEMGDDEDSDDTDLTPGRVKEKPGHYCCHSNHHVNHGNHKKTE